MTPRSILWVSVCALVNSSAFAQSLSERELEKKLTLFGEGFVISSIEAPVIENPNDWVNRQAGSYVYRFTTGSDDGEDIQVEKHVPDENDPENAWRRRIGEDLIEHFEKRDSEDIFIVEEVDHEHGYRMVVHPGVHLPTNIRPGDVWKIDAKISAYRTEDESFVDEGTLRALHSYEGAYRVRTPAGVFDTVVIREDFSIRLGPLKAEDDRLLFFARGVGLVAEEEGIRASAVLVYRIREDSAKVLVHYPGEATNEGQAPR